MSIYERVDMIGMFNPAMLFNVDLSYSDEFVDMHVILTIWISQPGNEMIRVVYILYYACHSI